MKLTTEPFHITSPLSHLYFTHWPPSLKRFDISLLAQREFDIITRGSYSTQSAKASHSFLPIRLLATLCKTQVLIDICICSINVHTFRLSFEQEKLVRGEKRRESGACEARRESTCLGGDMCVDYSSVCTIIGTLQKREHLESLAARLSAGSVVALSL